MAREQDLAGAVQEFRECGWKVAAGLKSRPAYWNADLLDLAGVALPGAELRTLDDALATTMADAYGMLTSKLQTDPPMPTERELLVRHLGGEIRNRTVRYIPAIDSLELTERCRYQDPPFFRGAQPRAADDG